MRLDDDSATVPIVGVIAGARVGHSIEVEGRNETHPRFGEQFIVTRAQVTAPRSVDGAIAWIASTFPHVGRRRAEALVKHFPSVDALWSAIVHAPQQLAEVHGITLERASEIRTAYLAARDDRDQQIALRGWGLTDSQVGRCIKHWGDASTAVEHIRANPYELFHRVDGFGWARADSVARASGIPDDAPVRVSAAIEHVMLKHLSAGNIHMVPGHLVREVRELLGGSVDPRVSTAGCMRAVRSGALVKRAARVYLQSIERSEAQLATLVTVRLMS